VRMPRKASEIILWNIVPKIIQQQKGIKFRSVTESKRPVQMNASALASRLGFDETLDWTNRHDRPPKVGNHESIEDPAAGGVSATAGRIIKV